MRIVWMIMKDAKSIIKNIVGQSIWCRLSIPLVQKGTFGLGNFGESEQAEMLEICDMIEKHLPEDCPTIEDLLWCYGDVMIPVRGDFI